VNETALIYTNFDVDSINTSQVTKRKTKWRHFFGLLQ